MQFLKQIKYEIINILKSKFLLIIGLLVIAAGVAVPVISLLTTRQNNYNNGISVCLTRGFALPRYGGN